MDIYIFSDNMRLVKRLEPLTKKKKLKVAIHPVKKMRKMLHSIEATVLFYLDISLCDFFEREIRCLSKVERVFFGIIDIKSKIKDCGSLIFNGAVDYIGKIDIENEFTTKRLQKVISFIESCRRDYILPKKIKRKPQKAKYIIAQQGWKGIISGHEYAFSIMFIELDGEKEMEKNYGRKNLKKAISTFIKYIKKHIYHFNGKIWMWKGVGGVILFPFNGKESLSALCGFRIMLYKYMHDVEESLFPNFISFRIALHLGNVLYFTGDTGEIISDAINSLFHLGRKYAEPGNFYITNDVMEYMPAGIKKYFIPAGKYEERAILRMKKPFFIVK